MGQILQYFSSEPPVCKNEEDLLKYAWKSVRLKCVDTLVKNEVTLKMRGMYGCSENNGIKVLKEYTPLVIACMYRDLKLATSLIKLGADVNLCPQENRFASEEGVPPLYYATNARDAEMVKLLFNSGADVNGLKGRQQYLNLQEPVNELYSIFDINQGTYSRSAKSCSRPQASLQVLVELYLEAGAKLNTTRWGPCLFYGRGRVFKANRPTTLNIPGPYFKCDTAILLLQHGVDPNMYNLSAVWFQFSGHNCFRSNNDCVQFSTLLETFLGAGYHLTSADINNRFIRENLKRIDVNVEEPVSLKQMCRSAIRQRLRKSSKDTTIFPAIDTIHIPTQLKNYLKLRDIIDICSSSIHCRANF